MEHLLVHHTTLDRMDSGWSDKIVYSLLQETYRIDNKSKLTAREISKKVHLSKSRVLKILRKLKGFRLIDDIYDIDYSTKLFYVV